MRPLPSKPAAMTAPHPDAAPDAHDQTWADLLSPARRALLLRGGLAATGLAAAATSASALAAGPADDVVTLRDLSTGELEVARVLEHGGHVGLTWNPKVQELIADFCLGAVAAKKAVA